MENNKDILPVDQQPVWWLAIESVRVEVDDMLKLMNGEKEKGRSKLLLRKCELLNRHIGALQEYLKSRSCMLLETCTNTLQTEENGSTQLNIEKRKDTPEDQSEKSAPNKIQPKVNTINTCIKKKRRHGKLPDKASDILVKWLHENIFFPYPSEEMKQHLSESTDLTIVQIENWFTNARRRHIIRPSEGGSVPTLKPSLLAQHFE